MRILRTEKHYIHKGVLPELKDETYKPEQEKDDEDEIVRTEFNKLKTFQKGVILLHYKLKMTYQEIGLKMNLNPEYVANIY
jgi:DNA-directed RNA polymerase specialized sigma24 family protein